MRVPWLPIAATILSLGRVLALPNNFFERAACNNDLCYRALLSSKVNKQASADCSAAMTASVVPCPATTTTTTSITNTVVAPNAATTTLTSYVTQQATTYSIVSTVSIMTSSVSSTVVVTSSTTITQTGIVTETATITVAPGAVNRRAAPSSCTSSLTGSAVLPTYASLCSNVSRYSSACACISVSPTVVTTLPRQTVTSVVTKSFATTRTSTATSTLLSTITSTTTALSTSLSTSATISTFVSTSTSLITVTTTTSSTTTTTVSSTSSSAVAPTKVAFRLQDTQGNYIAYAFNTYSWLVTSDVNKANVLSLDENGYLYTANSDISQTDGTFTVSYPVPLYYKYYGDGRQWVGNQAPRSFAYTVAMKCTLGNPSQGSGALSCSSQCAKDPTEILTLGTCPDGLPHVWSDPTNVPANCNVGITAVPADVHVYSPTDVIPPTDIAPPTAEMGPYLLKIGGYWVGGQNAKDAWGLRLPETDNQNAAFQFKIDTYGNMYVVGYDDGQYRPYLSVRDVGPENWVTLQAGQPGHQLAKLVCSLTDQGDGTSKVGCASPVLGHGFFLWNTDYNAVNSNPALAGCDRPMWSANADRCGAANEGLFAVPPS